MKKLGWLATFATLGLMLTGLTFGYVVQTALAGDASGEEDVSDERAVNEHTPYIALAIALVMGAAIYPLVSLTDGLLWLIVECIVGGIVYLGMTVIISPLTDKEKEHVRFMLKSDSGGGN